MKRKYYIPIKEHDKQWNSTKYCYVLKDKPLIIHTVGMYKKDHEWIVRNSKTNDGTFYLLGNTYYYGYSTDSVQLQEVSKSTALRRAKKIEALQAK